MSKCALGGEWVCVGALGSWALAGGVGAGAITAWLERSDLEDRVDGERRWPHDREQLHPALDDRAAELDEARHLDGAAEGDLAVSLREVHLTARGGRGGQSADQWQISMARRFDRASSRRPSRGWRPARTPGSRRCSRARGS